MGKSKKRQRSRSRGSDDESVSRRDILKRMKRLEKLLEGHERNRRSRSPAPTQRSRPREDRRSHEHDHRDATTPEASLSVRNAGRPASLSPASSGASLSPRTSRISLNSTSPTCRSNARSPVGSIWEQESQQPLILNEEVDLAEDLTNVLGEDVTSKPLPAENLHEAIAVRWGNIISQGLPKETENGLLQRYGVVENCKQLCPPLLNPEIETILTNDRAARDNFNKDTQTHIGKALAAIGKSMSLLLENTENIPRKLRDDLLAPLGDSGRILSNLIHQITLTRRNLITPTLNKGVKDLMEKTTPSEYLFGSDISERIKAAKSLQSTGKELKLSTPYFPHRGQTKGGGANLGKLVDLIRYRAGFLNL